MYPGGIADKTDNRFEARWLTRQMLGLLDGSTTSITVEKIGDGDEGFEFLVERQGVAEWHQCKRQTSETSWTITALAREAIIDNFRAKLQLSPSQRCVFVSTDIAKQVKLLQEKRAYAPTLAEFENIMPQRAYRQSRRRLDQPKTEIPIATACGPRVRASGTSVRLRRPEPFTLSERLLSCGKLLAAAVQVCELRFPIRRPSLGRRSP